MTTEPPPRWEVRFGDLAILRARLTQIDPAMFPLSLARLPASDADIAAAESRLGHALDPQHAELLRTGNGWQDAMLDGDVLGTDDIGQGPRWEGAHQRLDILYESAGTSLGGPPRAELVPVFMSPYQADVMALWTGGPLTDGGAPVYWFAHEVVGHWPNVYEWWLGGIELVRQDVEEMARKHGLLE